MKGLKNILECLVVCHIEGKTKEQNYQTAFLQLLEILDRIGDITSMWLEAESLIDCLQYIYDERSSHA